MSDRSPTRRRWLLAIGAGGAAAVTGCLSTDVGRPTPADAASTPGSLYESKKLVPDDGDAGDGFGRPVAVDGETAVVGAIHDEDPNGEGAGAAYVFEWTDGNWRRERKLAPERVDPGTNFGVSTAVAGDVALVGTWPDGDADAEEASPVYAFERTGGDWRQEATFVPDDGDGGIQFGVPMAVEGETAVVGDYRESTESGSRAGTAYVFERTDGAWHQQSRLVPDDAEGGQLFGNAVAVSGDTALVGAWLDDTVYGDRAGSAYVFERTGDAWKQRAKILPDDGDSPDEFGNAVALDGGTAVVGAYFDDDPNGDRAGSAYVFERADDTWHQQAKLAPDDGEPLDYFGFAVAVSDETALVSAWQDDNDNGAEAGAAYRFERADGAWHQRRTLLPDDGDADDGFGSSVALDGETALVGADGDDNRNGSDAGSAYVFEL